MSKIFGKEQYNNWGDTVFQLIKFCIVGLSNTCINYGVYIGILFVLNAVGLSLKYDYQVANIGAFLISVFWSFLWNSKFTFKCKSKGMSWCRRLLKTYLSYVFSSLILKGILLYLLVTVIGGSKIIAPLLTIALTMPINFILNKLWVYNK